MAMKRWAALALLLAAGGEAAPVRAATLIVVEARGGQLKPGQKVDSNRPLVLAEGERVTLLGPDGKAITLKGAFNGAPLANATTAIDPRQALAALIATRTARISAVGVVRGGADAAPLPKPWLVDISRSGDRCVAIGSQPVWWRPDAQPAQAFTIFPIDRSWRADFTWQAGQSEMNAPVITKWKSQMILILRAGDVENVVRVNEMPADIDNDFIRVSWMLEKGCVQQADALLRQIGLGQTGHSQSGHGQIVPAVMAIPASESRR